MPAADETPVSAAEAEALFSNLSEHPAFVLAVSGGPDSVALLVLMARWRALRERGPKLVAVTVDHGLRAESAAEAKAVGRLARSLGVPHRTLQWIGRKPKTGLPQAARLARYRLLAEAARKAGAGHVLTAHTRDDQAETILIRLARGSGVIGLIGMMSESPVPVGEGRGIMLLRPLLAVPKSRLIATLDAAKVPYADDPTNRDPLFTRPRIRALMPTLAREGLTAERLTLLARRVERIESAMAVIVSEARDRVAARPWTAGGPVTMSAGRFFELPAEIAMRVVNRAIDWTGSEGPVELAKLEALSAALFQARPLGRFRRTLAGAVITLKGEVLTVERAPARRGHAPKRP